MGEVRQIERIAGAEPEDTPYDRLQAGKAPGNGPLVEALSAGIDFITGFWQEKYLQEYIRQGGSKIKIDNNFALACSLITGGYLGHPLLEEQNKEMLLSWMEGDKGVKLTALRALGLSPGRITKFNARHMLRSLSEVIRLAGYTGLFVSIDNLEILLNRSSLQPIHYTKLKREDTYESIRQLVDDIDSLKNIMFVFAFDRELMDNDNAGLKSYQALWMRIQNEIVGARFNRFTDIVDLDRLAAQEYTPEILMEMSEKLAAVFADRGVAAKPVGHDTCEALIRQSRLGSVSVPRLVNRATLGGGE